MLETLEGRLKWERTVDGIRVELPAPLDRQNVIKAVTSGLLSWLLMCGLLTILDTTNRAHKIFMDWPIFLIVVPFYVGIDIWKILTKRTILTLMPNAMILNRGALEIGFNRRVFAYGRLCNLHYCESRRMRTAESENVKNSILCDVDDETIALISGVTSEEGEALIQKMMEVYNFPKYPV
jgi:hypothetical protein